MKLPEIEKNLHFKNKPAKIALKTVGISGAFFILLICLSIYPSKTLAFTLNRGDTAPPIVQGLNIQYLNESNQIKNQQEILISAYGSDVGSGIYFGQFYLWNPRQENWSSIGNAQSANKSSMSKKQYLSKDLLGKDFKIKVIFWDFASNVSAAFISDTFEIIDGTPPQGSVELLGPEPSKWKTGASKTIHWNIKTITPLKRIGSIWLKYGSASSLKISDSIAPSQQAIEFTLPLNAGLVSSKAYITLSDVCDVNNNCSDITSKSSFAITDGAPTPHEPWGAEAIASSLSSSPPTIERTLMGAKRYNDGHWGVVYLEEDGNISTTKGRFKRVMYRELNQYGSNWLSLTVEEHWEQDYNQPLLFDYSDFSVAKGASNGELHITYARREGVGNTPLDSSEIYYAHIKDGKVVTRNQVSFDNTWSHDPKIAVNSLGRVFILWRQGFQDTLQTGKNQPWFSESDGLSGWSEGEMLDEHTGPLMLAVNNNLPVAIYTKYGAQLTIKIKTNTGWTNAIPISKSAIPKAKFDALGLSNELVNSIVYPDPNNQTLYLYQNTIKTLDDLENVLNAKGITNQSPITTAWRENEYFSNSNNGQALISDSGRLEIFYLKQHPEENWNSRLYKLRVSVNPTSSIVTIEDNSPVLPDTLPDENILSFTVVPATANIQHLFFLKRERSFFEAGKTAQRVYHALYSNNESYLTAPVSSPTQYVEGPLFAGIYDTYYGQISVLYRGYRGTSVVFFTKANYASYLNDYFKLKSPVSRDINPQNVQFQWEFTGETAKSYTLQWGENPFVLENEITGLTSNSLTIAKTKAEKPLYWRVIARPNSWKSVYSQTQYFSTSVGKPDMAVSINGLEREDEREVITSARIGEKINIPLTVSNKGLGSLKIVNVALEENSGNFSLQWEPVSELPIDAAANGAILLTPTQPGIIQTKLRVTSNDENNPIFSVTIKTAVVPEEGNLTVTTKNQYVNANKININGATYLPGAVTVSGNFGSRTISQNGPGNFSIEVPLEQNKSNFITVTSTDIIANEYGPIVLTITEDSTPPRPLENVKIISEGNTAVVKWNLGSGTLPLIPKNVSENNFQSTSSPTIALNNQPAAPHVPGELLITYKNQVENPESFANAPQEISREITGIGVTKITLASSEDELTALSYYQNNNEVESASFNYLINISENFPNDPEFDELWGLYNPGGRFDWTRDADIDALEAWAIQTGQSNEVIVAVLDTGVDFNHPDLANNIWTNKNEIPNNGIDDDNNGYIDDVRGWDFFSGDNDPQDENYHGTHVAGTIAAVGNNNRGVIGVAPNVKIMPIRFLGPKGSGTELEALQGINYAIKNGARIINASYGYSGLPWEPMEQTLFKAYENKVILSAAAGNDNKNTDISPHYPSAYPLSNVIASAASDSQDRYASFSNYGVVSVDFAAPGLNVFSTTPGNAYQSLSGTSMAAPHTSGAIALLLAQEPDLSIEEIRALLFAGVDPLSNASKKTATNGRLNINNSLKILQEYSSGFVGIYRQEQPFNSINGLNPIARIDDITLGEYVDSIETGHAYYYAISSEDLAGNIGSVFYSERIGQPLPQAQPTANLQANNLEGPLTVSPGTSLDLTWNSQNVSSCEVSVSGYQGWYGNRLRALSGTQKTGPLFVDSAYILTCNDSLNNQISDTLNVHVASTPTVNLRGDDIEDSLTVPPGTSVELKWSSWNTKSCQVSVLGYEGWYGNILSALSGTQKTGPLSVPSKYSVTCIGQDDSIVKDTLDVNIAPTPTLTANLLGNGASGILSVPPGTSVNLEWSSKNASSCEVSVSGYQGWYGNRLRALSGTQSTGSLFVNSIYTVTCTDSDNRETRDTLEVKIL